jgi:hypothetical protein
VIIKTFMAAAAVGLALTLAAPASAQTAGRGSAQKRPAAAAKTTSVRIAARDEQGAPLSDVHLFVSRVDAPDAAPMTFTTAAAGTAIVPDLKNGAYRVRCERDGFVTLEREFAVHGGGYSPLDITLKAAPPPAAPPAPEPPPPSAAPPPGPPVTMSIVDFLDQNFIGREPLKESIVACEPLETVRLLQMHDGIAAHVHDGVDEIVYVIAGEGAVHIGDQATPLRAGSLVVVPNGKSHSFDHRGKNPLVMMSTLVGAACDPHKNPPGVVRN